MLIFIFLSRLSASRLSQSCETITDWTSKSHNPLFIHLDRAFDPNFLSNRGPELSYTIIVSSSNLAIRWMTPDMVRTNVASSCFHPDISVLQSCEEGQVDSESHNSRHRFPLMPSDSLSLFLKHIKYSSASNEL